MTQVLVYWFRCAIGPTFQDSELLLSAISSEDGVEISVSATSQVIGRSGVDVLTGGINYLDGGDSLQYQLDDVLLLSVCRAALAAHDVELEMPDAHGSKRLYRFAIPVLASNR